MYLPNLRVFTLNTQSSFAPIIVVGSIDASEYLGSALLNFNFSTTLLAERCLGLRGLRVAFACSIIKSSSVNSVSIALRKVLISPF